MKTYRVKRFEYWSYYHLSYPIGRILALVVTMTISGLVYAETENDWSFQLEPMYVAVFGADTDVAELNFTSGNVSSFSTSTETMNVDMGGDFGFRGELPLRIMDVLTAS